MKRSAVITGASSGIGRALARELHARGWELGLCARRLSVLQELRDEILAESSAGGRVEVARVDVQQDESVAEVLRSFQARLGSITTVVVNAGVNRVHRVGRGRFAEDRATVAINLIGAMATVDAAVEMFRDTGAGHIVGISSLAALRPLATQAAYCASKAGLNAYLDSVRLEVGDRGIRVTTIMPGFVETGIVEDIGKYPFCISTEQAAREIADHIERGSRIGIVPAYPWRLLAPALAYLPDAVVRRLGK